MPTILPTLINLFAALTTWYISAAVLQEFVGTPGNWYDVTIAGLVFVGPVIAIAQFLLLRTRLAKTQDEATTHKNIMIVVSVYSLTFWIWLAISTLTPTPQTDFVKLMDKAMETDSTQSGN